MRAENFARDKEANFPTSFWVAGEEASPCGAAGQYAKGRRCCPSPNAACGWPPGARWSVVEPQQLAPARAELRQLPAQRHDLPVNLAHVLTGCRPPRVLGSSRDPPRNQRMPLSPQAIPVLAE